MCEWYQVTCNLQETVASGLEDIIGRIANAMLEAVSTSLITVGTFWTQVPSPDLSGADSAVQFVHNQTLFIILVLAIGSVIFAGIQMAWHRRGEPAWALLRSLVTLVVTSAAGVTAAQMLVSIADATSTAVMDTVKTDDNGNFASSILDPTLSFTAATSPMLMILVGLIGVIANIIQIMLMWARSALLILLCGMIPLTGAITNTKWGDEWFRKAISWFVAVAAFKPAASIVYAVAIKVVSSSKDNNGFGDTMVQFIVGVMLMILSVFALPALIAFIVPAAGAIGSGGGSGIGTAGQLATGAMYMRGANNTGGTTAHTPQAQDSSTGATSTPGATTTTTASTSTTSTTSTSTTAGAAKTGGAASSGGAASAGGAAGAGGAAAAAGPAAAAVVAAGAIKKGVDAGINAAASQTQPPGQTAGGSPAVNNTGAGSGNAVNVEPTRYDET